MKKVHQQIGNVQGENALIVEKLPVGLQQIAWARGE